MVGDGNGSVAQSCRPSQDLAGQEHSIAEEGVDVEVDAVFAVQGRAPYQPRGNLKMNLAPLPGSLVTQILPP